MKDFIREAFYILCKTNEVKAISVRTIINRAGINRSTFYYYYSNKQDLIQQLQEEVLDALFNILTYRENRADHLLGIFSNYHSPEVYASCNHIKENLNRYKVWFNDIEFLDKFSKRLLEYLTTISSNRLYCMYFTYGTIGYFNQWISRGCPGNSDEIAEEILQMSKHSFSEY